MPDTPISTIRHVAVVDVGKTNAKVELVSADDASDIALRTAATAVADDGPYPHLDQARTWDFVLGALAEVGRAAPIDAIAVTGHGSAGALIDPAAEDDGLKLPILDYEHPGPDELFAEYDAIRPPFSESFTPRLPAGLNLGAQLFWQRRRFPAAFDATARYVNYPQYWSWRLSGVAATEMCSMGAHSDMWDPMRLTWSSLVTGQRWESFLAPLRSAFDRLGPLRPALARKLGLDPAPVVVCGLHDSSASLLPSLKERTPPFAVVSTGTWVILFAIGADLSGLDPERDTLANVSALGDPVACGRFMAGREFERLTAGHAVVPTDADIAHVLDARIVALPTFVPGVGPFMHEKGRWSFDPERLTPGERSAAASLYLALVTAESLAATGAAGPVVIEGPFARNALFCRTLAALVGRPVEPSETGTGTTIGAIVIATGALPRRPAPPKPVAPLAHPALTAYAEAWRKAARGT